MATDMSVHNVPGEDPTQVDSIASNVDSSVMLAYLFKKESRK
jgi:hypothetical protein